MRATSLALELPRLCAAQFGHFVHTSRCCLDAAAFRSALRERLEELKSVDAATLAAKSKLAASRRASARMSAKVSAATAAPIIDDDPAVSAMEKLLKVVCLASVSSDYW